MSVLDDINNEIRRQRYEHRRTAPLHVPIFRQPDDPIKDWVDPADQQEQSPEPTKLTLTEEVLYDLRGTDFHYMFRPWEMTYYGLNVEFVPPDELEAPGWRVE